MDRQLSDPAVPSGWTAVWWAPRWQGALHEAAPEVAAALFVAIAIGLSWLVQSPGSPFVRATSRLFGQEMDEFVVDALGARAVVAHLETVAWPATAALLVIAPVFWLAARRRPKREGAPRAVYFYDDRLLFVGRRQRLELPLDPAANGNREAPGRRRSLARRLFVDDGWVRFFWWPNGELGGFPPAARLWRLETPDGRAVENRSDFVISRLGRCRALRRHPSRGDMLSGWARELPVAVAALVLAALPAVAGPYPWVPFLSALGGGRSPTAPELAARAEAGGRLGTGRFFSAMLEGIDDPSVSRAAYRRWLDGYLGSGGAAEIHRIERAVVELGLGHPSIAKAWLGPDVQVRGLELRLAVALDDRTFERSFLSSRAGSASPSTLAALVLFRQGRPDEAARLVPVRVETPEERATAAIVLCLAGRADTARALLQRPDVAAWRRAAPVSESRWTASPIALDEEVRGGTVRASAERCLGDESAAQTAWARATRVAGEAGLPGLVDPLRRWIFDQLDQRSAQGAA